MEEKRFSTPKADRVRLVAALPDMGDVGELVTRFLIEHLKPRSFAEVISYDKPFVVCKDGLVSEVPSVYKFYFSETAKLVIMSGDSQPRGSRELFDVSNKTLDIAESVGRLDRVYTCGGYQKENVEEPRVYGVTNNPLLFRELDELGIREIGSEVSSITWFNGIILGVAKRRNIDGIGLYGELSQPGVPQPATANAVVKSLNALLSLPEVKRRARFNRNPKPRVQLSRAA